jgi:hypothetical protein
MIPDTTQVTVESNIPSDPTNARAMGVDPTAMAQIMSSMTNLYTNRGLAVLREYASNARDAHLAAGRPELPIEVTLPSLWDQTLVFTDHGVGMSRTDVLDCYAQYGASSKRASNLQAGSFGFGCKSAFTISDHFTVVAVKDGVQITALFSRSAEGGGEAQVLSEQATSAPNGVTVQIPVPGSMIDQLKAQALEFFAAWPTGTVLLDGRDPARLEGRGYSCGPVTLLTRSEAEEVFGSKFRKGQYVLMGNVMYPAELPTADFAGSIIFRAEIGEVDLPPSREGVRDSARTKDFIDRTFTTWCNTLRDQVAARSAQATTAYEVVSLAWQLATSLEATGLAEEIVFTCRGTKVSPSISPTVADYQISEYRDSDRLVRLNGYDTRERTPRTQSFGRTHSPVVIITGYEKFATTRYAIQLARKYGARFVLYCQTEQDVQRLGWLADGNPTAHIRSVEEAEVEAAEVRRLNRVTQPRAPKRAGRYQVIGTDQYGRIAALEKEATVIADDTTPLTWTNHDAARAQQLFQLATLLKVELRVVNLHGGRSSANLRKLFGDLVVEPAQAEAMLVQAAMTLLGDPRELGRLATLSKQAVELRRYMSEQLYSQLCAQREGFTDPNLRALFGPRLPLQAEQVLTALLGTLSGHPALKSWYRRYQRACNAVPQVSRPYPLLGAVRYGESGLVPHLVIYANAAYAASLAAS